MFNFIIKNKIKKICKKDNRAKHFLSLDKINSVLVVFETTDYVAADAFVEKLERLGKQVKVCCYKAKDDKYDYSETPYRVIVPKVDTNSSGIPQQPLLDQLKSLHCDALIDLTIGENYTLEYIVASLDIPLKVGLKKNSLQLHDLAISNLPEIKGESGVDELGKQVLHYLSTIHSVEP